MAKSVPNVRATTIAPTVSNSIMSHLITHTSMPNKPRFHSWGIMFILLLSFLSTSDSTLPFQSHYYSAAALTRTQNHVSVISPHLTGPDQVVVCLVGILGINLLASNLFVGLAHAVGLVLLC
jgi:hypothetical protein